VADLGRLAKFLNDINKMLTGAAFFLTGIEVGRGGDVSVAKHLPHHLIGTGVGMQVDRARDMPEQVRVDCQARERQGRFHDLQTQRVRSLVVQAFAGEQIAVLRFGLAMGVDVPVQHPDSLWRQFELQIGTNKWAFLPTLMK